MKATRELEAPAGMTASRTLVLSCFFALVLCCWACQAASAPLPPEEGAGRWAILLSGISGDGDLQKEYNGMIRDLHAVLAGPLQVPGERIHVLVDDPALLPELHARKSTRAGYEEVCRLIAAQAVKTDQVFLFIAGHGTSDGRSYRLNLVGPDPSAEEMAAKLYAIPAANFVVVNTTASSGASIPAFAGPGKVVVTATKSGAERNRTHMGRYFVEALKANSGDVDKNGRVSILEAFNHAAAKVEEYYAAEGNLQTEHPVLEDSGEGEPHMRPGPDNGDGLLARTTYLDAGSGTMAAESANPEARQLADEAQGLEKQIEALKYVKSEMSEAEYEQKLEALLVRLAEIRARRPKK